MTRNKQSKPNPDDMSFIDRERFLENMEKNQGRKKSVKWMARQERKHITRDGKPKVQPVTARAQAVGDHWYALAEEQGILVPFNATWVGNQIHAKVIHDQQMRPYLDRGRFEEVERWIDKMSEVYWAEYVDDSVKSFSYDFLVEAWDDVRDYALSCLTAAWLKEHGRRVSPPEYRLKKEQELLIEIAEAKKRVWIEDALSEDEPQVSTKLAPNRRPVVRSAPEETGEANA